MITSFHNCLFTFDSTGTPVLFVIAEENYSADNWKLALSIRSDSNLEARNHGRYMRLFDNVGGRFLVDSPLAAQVKSLISSKKDRALIVVIKAKSIDNLKSALVERLSRNIPASLQREKELTSNPVNLGKFSRNTETVEKFQRLNSNFLKDALRHHWLHTLTGLLLIEGEKLLIEAGGTPLWAKDLVSEIQVRPLEIRTQE